MQDRSIKRIIKNYSWGNRWGDSGNSVKLYFLGSKSQMVIAAMKLKEAYSLEGKL